jgi:hypothetical protein
MKITLTSEQKKALELRHNKVRDVHECDRIKAPMLLEGAVIFPPVIPASF